MSISDQALWRCDTDCVCKHITWKRPLAAGLHVCSMPRKPWVRPRRLAVRHSMRSLPAACKARLWHFKLRKSGSTWLMAALLDHQERQMLLAGRLRHRG